MAYGLQSGIQANNWEPGLEDSGDQHIAALSNFRRHVDHEQDVDCIGSCAGVEGGKRVRDANISKESGPGNLSQLGIDDSFNKKTSVEDSFNKKTEVSNLFNKTNTTSADKRTS